MDFVYKKYEDSLLLYDWAIENGNQKFESLYYKGWFLKSLKFYDEALDCFNKSLELRTFMNKSWNGKAIVLSSKGNFEEALNCYDEMLNLNPYNTLHWSGIAAVFQRLNKINDFKRFDSVRQSLLKLYDNNDFGKLAKRHSTFLKLIKDFFNELDEKKINKEIDGNKYQQIKQLINALLEDIKQLKQRIINYNLELDFEYHFDFIDKLESKLKNIKDEI